MENNKITKLELLAPAKNYEFGVAAINCGADALYIGAPAFGARKAAANSVEDIEKLVKYAHLFDVQVYVAFNTIIFNDEIDSAQRLVSQLYEIGVDALIVQDMAFAKMKIPPIRKFASTQTANISLERVKFLESVGFERVILERALSLNEITEICSSTNVDIECFVHGAICVSYSGNCYMSEYVASRSANRGECAQPCRSLYNLVDEYGQVLIRDSHLLSLKDLSYGESFDDLVVSGVTSFKIEGRLKDIVYLKNSVSYFNNIIDNYINQSEGRYLRSSKGCSVVDFNPNPSRSFSRSFTSYLLKGKVKDIATFESAKSVGEYIGEVKGVAGKRIKVAICENIELSSGDGICFIGRDGSFSGSYINKVFGNDMLELSRSEGATSGAKIYRNLDKKFVDKLTSSVERRTLDATITLGYGKATIMCNKLNCSVEFECDEAKNREKAIEGLTVNFSKSGESIFNIVDVVVEGVKTPFLPIKVQNEIRRSLFDMMEQKIGDNYNYIEGKPLVPAPLESVNVDYKANVANDLARQFYSECGAAEIDEAVELSHNFDEVELMRMGYCLRREIGRCLKKGGDRSELYLQNNNRKFLLKFDCKHCEMVVVKSY